MVRSTTIVLLTSVVALFSQEGSLRRGRVVDQKGTPVAHVEIAQFWLAGTSDPGGLRAYGETKSDAQGRFELKSNESPFPTTLFAVDTERQRGEVVVVTDAIASQNIRIELHPLRKVRYLFRSPGMADISQSRITIRPRSGPVFGQIIGPAEGTLSLPAGSYVLGIPSASDQRAEVDFQVPDRDITIDAIDLPTNITQFYGHPAPSLATTIPANTSSFSSQRLRGKWVLVYFWGYWCAPCVNEGLPKLAKFYQENRREQDRFEIVAIHENGVAGKLTLADLKDKLSILTKTRWGGTPLPFPVLLDESGETIKAWGISSFPTMAIINPDGELRRGDLEALRGLLRSH